MTTEYYVIASSTFNNNNEGYRISILASPTSPISSPSLQMDATLFPGSEVMEGYCRDETVMTKYNQSRNDAINKPISSNLQYQHTSPIGNNKVQKMETKINHNNDNRKEEERKSMKGKVILDFGIDKGTQTSNESKFRTLSNLVHGTKSIVKEKIHSLQHPPPQEKKLSETDTTQTIQQFPYDSHHHKDFTATRQPRTNIKKKNADSFIPINNDAKIQISMDPAAASRMLPFLFCVVTSSSSAFLGTIRFLGPL